MKFIEEFKNTCKSLVTKIYSSVFAKELQDIYLKLVQNKYPLGSFNYGEDDPILPHDKFIYLVDLKHESDFYMLVRTMIQDDSANISTYEFDLYKYIGGDWIYQSPVDKSCMSIDDDTGYFTLKNNNSLLHYIPNGVFEIAQWLLHLHK